ncbi:YozQ family protein [Halobacillus mangrovi]|uniref:DUF4025 domain-containing protein n=1 Tax=Halobacillus mangrovi TaxID=402384 RepID=A0A1W5ZTM4_9BACI|nr:YozQ family protein [Halobacillus mangrovi]ARI76638.1 hypothetical protein HM131_07205 [Halobacillus mangrovi]
MSRKSKNNSEEIAGRTYEPEDYNKADEVSKGLATTHEQASDTLTEGTIDGTIDRVDKDGHLISNDGEEISRNKNREKTNGKTK